MLKVYPPLAAPVRRIPDSFGEATRVQRNKDCGSREKAQDRRLEDEKMRKKLTF
jgi:hypothetical protein